MPKIVLIVDDSDICAETLEIAFEPIPGLVCRTARNAREAMAFLRNGPQPSALVTDLNLPNTSGFDLIRELRSDNRFASLPVVLISGDSDPDIEKKARAAGATAFFAKPYSPAAVRRTLERLLC